jgi:hypothetical protein
MYLYAKKQDPKRPRDIEIARTDEEIDALPEEERQIDYEHFWEWPKQVFYLKPDVWEIGYWRKANQIHNWFVTCAGGVDDCQPVYVHPEQLMDLKDRCEQVLATPVLAAKLLPTEGGFFFGSTDYDEWYLNDLENTLEIIKLAGNDFTGHDLIYRASW